MTVNGEVRTEPDTAGQKLKLGEDGWIQNLHRLL